MLLDADRGAASNDVCSSKSETPRFRRGKKRMLQIHKTVTSPFSKIRNLAFFFSLSCSFFVLFLFLSLFFFCVFDYKWNRVLISSVGSKKSRRREDRLVTVCGCYWGALHSAFLYFFFLCGMHAILILCHIVICAFLYFFNHVDHFSTLCVSWLARRIHSCHATYPMSRLLVPCPVFYIILYSWNSHRRFALIIVRLTGCLIKTQMKKERKSRRECSDH